VSELQAGWEALSSARWEEALAHFAAADDDPSALEGIGIAQWWLDDADATLEARQRAYRLYRAQGDTFGAARVASALAWDAILFGERAAVARGWLERASRLLAGETLRPEHAWLAVREAEVAVHLGELEIALDAARRAIAIGEQLGLEEVQVAGRSQEGLALVHQGAVADGMRRLDESAVSAIAGEVEDLMWIGKVCCNLIAACESVGDVDRATQWSGEVKEFARRWELRTLFNVCRTQYAAVLLEQGTWGEAETELQAALEVFESGRRAALIEGIARLGELRRRQGRLEEARTLFARAELHRVARAGAVELALDEDDAVTALALAQRLVRSVDGSRRLLRVAALQLLVRAAAAAGRPAVAANAVAELEESAACVGTTGARASAARAAGVWAAANGDLETARLRLEDAVDLLGVARAPFERAEARLELALVLDRLGLDEQARAEAERARVAFEELDARRRAAEAARLSGASTSAASAAGILTRREREVLGLVARGRSNGEIAEELVVSRHTVHRHVANILRKLDEPTRAAAAARAVRDGLV